MCGMQLKAISLVNCCGGEDFVHEGRLGVVEQLVHPLLAGAGHRLVGRHHHALDAELVVQRLQRHHHLDGGAVRVGDDVALAEVAQRLRVHLRHHQRDVGLHAELAGVVDHHAAGGGGARRVHGRDRGAGREQADVPAAEVEGLQVPHLEHLLLAERHLWPVDRPEASAATSSTGNRRSASVFSISRPTAPVAPTTATL